MLYKTTDLGETIPAVTSSDPNGGSVTFSAYSQVNFNNGPAAIAIVDPSGALVDYIGYGGADFAPANGAAVGIKAMDIGVFEPENSPLTSSLQIMGVGKDRSDFDWRSPRYGTPGKINEGQVFICF